MPPGPAQRHRKSLPRRRLPAEYAFFTQTLSRLGARPERADRRGGGDLAAPRRRPPGVVGRLS